METCSGTDLKHEMLTCPYFQPTFETILRSTFEFTSLGRLATCEVCPKNFNNQEPGVNWSHKHISMNRL